MPQIDDSAAILLPLLKKSGADFVEARLEESRASYLTYRGRELEAVGRTAGAGGNVRALVRGGWGFTSFNSLADLPGKVAQAVAQARLAGRETSRLAAVAPVAHPEADPLPASPVAIPLEQKKALLDEYNEIIWGTPGLQTSVIGYGDSQKKSIYLNSEGSHIAQQRADVTLRLTAIAARDGDVQQVGLSLGSRGDFAIVRGRHQEVTEMARRAVALLDAPRVAGGEYTVVLDPVLAGVFVHEAFGHLSESDFVYENERMKEIMTLGREFGPPELNIVDSARLPGRRGSYDYDDEGTPSQHTYLIREGKLVGRLHSRETAARMNEAPTGNARSISYHYPPIVRMSNTYIEAGQQSLADLIADIKEGVYARNWYGGTTSMEMFTFSAGEAYMIRNGRIAETVRPVVLTGNVFSTLKNIDGIGNDLELNEGGGCGKSGQFPLPVSDGSPHLRIRRCLIGGR